MKLYEPWPEPYTINARSPYGPRKHPITRKVKFHHGVDVAAPTGTPLIAGADGTIAHKGSGASGGNVLIIRHEDDWHTVYYHLQKPSHRQVGEQVKAGDLVAHVGSTGRSTGPHLHYELRRSRKWGDTVDPVPHFQGKYAAKKQEQPEEPQNPQEAEKPQEPVSAPKPRRWVPMPNFGISGRYKADDVRAVFSFLRGRK